MAEQSHTGITRREMIGIGGVGALAGLAVAGLPLTAAAAPANHHVAAWGPVLQDLGPTIANLTYVGIDGAAFQAQNEDSYLDSLTGRGVSDHDGQLIAPLQLPVGSVVQQINIAYLCPENADLSVQIFRRDFLSESNVEWAAVATGVAPGGDGALTATINLATPVTIEPASSYTIQMRVALAATSVRGLTVGYVAPTAGFVPFAGATPRVFDSRPSEAPATGPKGKVGGGDEITIDLGRAGVRGALLNLTVTESEGAGFAAVFPDTGAWPGNSSINWLTPGATLANGVVTAVAANGRIRIRVDGSPDVAAHLVVDRLGWFV